MKIFPLKPVSTYDKFKNLIKIMSGEYTPDTSALKKTQITSPANKITEKTGENHDKFIRQENNFNNKN